MGSSEAQPPGATPCSCEGRLIWIKDFSGAEMAGRDRDKGSTISAGGFLLASYFYFILFFFGKVLFCRLFFFSVVAAYACT